MEPLTMEDYWRMWDKKMEEIDNNDPWLVYVAEKSKTSCMKCQENHTKRFRSSDASKPEIPVHPNCKCKYVPLSEATEEMTTMRSINVIVKSEPVYKKKSVNEMVQMLKNNEFSIDIIRNNIMSELDPYNYGLIVPSSFSINSIESMLTVLEKQCKPGTLGELVIINHGENPGVFELGNPRNTFEKMTEEQMDRLYNLLSPNAIIDLRMCYGIKDENSKKIVQDLANKLRCKIRAYANKVSVFGTRPIYFGKNSFKDIFSTPEEKIFYPK